MSIELKRPLLAADLSGVDLSKLKYPLLASPKIDGIRALVSGGVGVSRSMKPIRNKYTQLLLGVSALEGLDGELAVGNPWDKNLMQQTSSGVMSADGFPPVHYYVFDKWNSSEVFNNRLQLAEQVVYNYNAPAIRFLRHTLINSHEELLAYEQEHLTLGYEGVMLRSLSGIYKQNRSTLREGILLKLKRFHDAECIVQGFEPLYRNQNPATVDERGFTKRSSVQEGKVADEYLGSLIVRSLDTGVLFSIGSGFTEHQRRVLWDDRDNLVGRIVKYKSFKVGVKEAPRFPIFLGFRDKDDMS